MTLNGLFYPFTDTGRSSLIPPLPWHYTGNCVAAEYEADPDQLRKLVPDGMELADGRVALHFFDWQSGAEDEGYLDPIRSQYKEALFFINVNYKGKETAFCPFIWVDNDVAIMRGLLQGYPKQLGSVWITRPYPLPGKAAPVIGAGGRFAGSCSAKDHRLIDIKIELKEEGNALPAPGLGTGVINRMALPDITEEGMGGMLIDQFVVKSNSSDVSVANIWNGSAEVSIHDDYYPELAYLRPVGEAKGIFFSMCFTLNSLGYDK